MTALNWQLSPEHVLILSDTLALHYEDRRPGFMATKVFALPHAGLCIAGTGAQPLVQQFFAHANSNCVFSDIAHLDEYAPGILRSIWLELLNQPDCQNVDMSGATSTVYTYGWCERESAFVGYAYRSTHDFASHSLSNGMAVKPAPNSGEVPELSSLEEFVGFVAQQKNEDRARPRSERIGIGGEVILTLMTRDEAGFTTIEQRPIIRFDDFESDWDIILAKLPENQHNPRSIAILENDP